jgi:DNA repair exonuclease SbcCD nuclease subunit
LNGSRPSKEVRVLHTSDNHITGLSSCVALGVLVDKANELEVDLVLLAGDFFDNSRLSEEVVRETIDQLSRLEMPSVLLPGNHDQLDADSIYHHSAFNHLPPDLHIIRSQEGEGLLFPEMGVRVWGRPTYYHDMSFRPLRDPPPRDGPYWHIGMAHGLYVPPGEYPGGSSPIFAHEIEATGYDYVALGHVDGFKDISQGTVRAAYSGAPVRDLDGSRLGHVALVNLHPESGVQIEKVPLEQ